MNRRVRMRDGTQLADDILERVLLWKHVEQIRTFAYHILDPIVVQVMREPHSVIVAVGFHLEYELADVAEAKATMPPCI